MNLELTIDIVIGITSIVIGFGLITYATKIVEGE
jgi:hypothetical protein